MSMKVRLQLCVMVFFEFFIWGAWLVTMGTYLHEIGFSGVQSGTAYSMNNIAAIVSPFFIGMIADRFFSAQKVMAFMHALSAVFLYLASQTTDVWTFTAYILAHSLCYMPTLALINSISFHQMKEPGKEFPYIRIFGTIGWIVAGWIISGLSAEKTNIPLQIAAGASVLLAIWSLFLPDTPPAGKGKKVTVSDILGLKALSLLKDKSFFVFSLSSLLICIPLAFYYNYTNLYLSNIGMPNPAGTQSFGQVSETLFMLAMPLCFARLGVKKMIGFGMLAWVLRYLCFALGASDVVVWMIYTGILLHGICYDFFFVTGQIYVDKVAPKEIQSNAQGFITLLTYGVGMTIGSLISGYIIDMFVTRNDLGEIVSYAWKGIWLVPCCIAAVVLVLFVVFFKDPKNKTNT